MKKAEIVDHLKANPGWVLQFCDGIRGSGWWWLRNKSDQSETINLDGRSAQSASRCLQRLQRARHGETDYVLPNVK